MRILSQALLSGLNLSDNPYYTNEMGLRIVLLSRKQFDAIPDRTVLFDIKGKGYLKGEQNIELDHVMGGFINVGFPDGDQLGFEEFGPPLSGSGNASGKNCIQTTSELMMAPLSAI